MDQASAAVTGGMAAAAARNPIRAADQDPGPNRAAPAAASSDASGSYAFSGVPIGPRSATPMRRMQ